MRTESVSFPAGVSITTRLLKPYPANEPPAGRALHSQVNVNDGVIQVYPQICGADELEKRTNIISFRYSKGKRALSNGQPSWKRMKKRFLYHEECTNHYKAHAAYVRQTDGQKVRSVIGCMASLEGHVNVAWNTRETED